MVGNVGMSGRKQFLLGNVPNRISHNARCTVVIVNTASLDGEVGVSRGSRSAPEDTSVYVEGRLLGRAWRIGRVMVEGFFHADPHPGNMKWWNEKIYFLDLGMAGEVEAELRELVLLSLLAFSQRDAAFLSEVVLMLSGGEGRGESVDVAAFRENMEQLIACYRDLSLKELRLGPILQEVTEISVRRNVRVPASLALMGKAFGQMQMAAAELDPDLDLFAVAESFVLRNTVRQLAGGLDPKKVFYETQKARIRLVRLLEAVEGTVGARPGSSLQVDFRGTESLEETITQASRRLSLALGLGGSLVATVMTANSTRTPRWMPVLMGGVGSTLAAGLIFDSLRQRR